VGSSDCRTFVVGNGKTFILEGDKRFDFGDFVLKLLGELQSLKTEGEMREGFWVASCGVQKHNHLDSRSVVWYALSILYVRYSTTFFIILRLTTYVCAVKYLYLQDCGFIIWGF
jgi:hypothetical protein